MGLLSDPEPGTGKWVKILLNIHRQLSCFCYIAAVIWFILLANNSFNNGTYFSENALLPGLVRSHYSEEKVANRFFTDLLSELEEKYYDRDEVPVSWLEAKMSQLHLEVHTHNYTLHYPMGMKQVFEGTNVYGILRAPRTASLEAVVVSVPFRPIHSHQKGTAAGIALMLAVAKFARSQKYWAKDIIFLVTQHEQLGIQAWLEAYHGITGETETFYSSLGTFITKEQAKHSGWQIWDNTEKVLNPGKLTGRSGAIQAAVNLEFHTPKIKYIEVKVEGLNGQLPNLDLVNLANKMCAKSGIHHSFKNSYSWISFRNQFEDWLNNLQTLLAMIVTQFGGVPNGNHGLFHRFGIPAVTLEGRGDNDVAGEPPRLHTLSICNFHRLGVMMEGILRSLNNLLERFHQSFFFYMLAATDRFISIGQYIPVIGFLIGALLIKTFAMWLTLQPTVNPDPENEMEVKDCDNLKDTETKTIDNTGQIDEAKKTVKEDRIGPDGDTEVVDQEDSDRQKLLAKDQKNPEDKEKEKRNGDHLVDPFTAPDLSKISIGTNYLMMHIIGYLVMKSPPLLNKYGSQYVAPFLPEKAVYDGLAILSAILIAVTPFLINIFKTTKLTIEELSFINGLALIELSTVCLVVGMHNFPLGLTIGLIYVPLGLLVGITRKTDSIFRRTAIRAIYILFHPLVVLTLSMIATSIYLFPEDHWDCVFRGRDAALQAIMFAIVDSAIYGNWLFSVATVFILPIWLLFWQTVCYTV